MHTMYCDVHLTTGGVSILCLLQDHHCVWINNCVGYMNYQPFISFILHVAIGSIYSLVCTAFS